MAEKIKLKDLLNMGEKTHARKNYSSCNAKKVKEIKKKNISIYSVRCFEEYSDKKGHLVGIKLSKDELPLPEKEVQVMCTCDAWKYWGSDFHAKDRNYKMKELRAKPSDGSFPVKRDPKGKNLVCKHVYLCLRRLLKGDQRKNYGK